MFRDNVPPASRIDFVFDTQGKGQLTLFGRSFAYVSPSKFELEAKEGCFRAALCRGILNSIHAAAPANVRPAASNDVHEMTKIYEDMSTLAAMPTRDLPSSTPSAPKAMSTASGLLRPYDAAKVSDSNSVKSSAPSSSSSSNHNVMGNGSKAISSIQSSATNTTHIGGASSSNCPELLANRASSTKASEAQNSVRSDQTNSITPRSSPNPPSDYSPSDLELEVLDPMSREHLLLDLEEVEQTEEAVWRSLAQKEAPLSALCRLTIFCHLHLIACRNPDTYKPFIRFDIVDNQQIVQLRIANSQAFVLTCNIDPKDGFMQTEGLAYIHEGLARQALAASVCSKLGQKRPPKPSIKEHFERVARSFQDPETLGANLKPSRPVTAKQQIPGSSVYVPDFPAQNQRDIGQPLALPRLRTAQSSQEESISRLARVPSTCLTSAPSTSTSYTPFGNSRPLQRSTTSPIVQLSARLAPASPQILASVPITTPGMSRSATSKSASSPSTHGNALPATIVPLSERLSQTQVPSDNPAAHDGEAQPENAVDEDLRARMLELRQKIARTNDLKRPRSSDDQTATANLPELASRIAASESSETRSPLVTTVDGGPQTPIPVKGDREELQTLTEPPAKRVKSDSPSDALCVPAPLLSKRTSLSTDQEVTARIRNDSVTKVLNEEAVIDTKNLIFDEGDRYTDYLSKLPKESRFSSIFQPAGPEIWEKLSQLPTLIRNMQTMTEIVKALAEGVLTYDLAREALYALKLPRIVDGPAFDALDAIWLNSPAHLLQKARLDDGYDFRRV